MCFINGRENQGAIKNEQSSDTANIGQTTQNKDKQNHRKLKRGATWG